MQRKNIMFAFCTNKKKLTIFFSAILLLAFFIYLQPALADKYGLDNTAGEAGLKSETSFDPPLVIGQLVGILLSFLGVIFLILMIYGGFLWMTARGNEQQVTKAKDLITAAVIGLIIVLSAYAITAYVGQVLTQPPDLIPAP